jgi:hypothetical protein
MVDAVAVRQENTADPLAPSITESCAKIAALTLTRLFGESDAYGLLHFVWTLVVVAFYSYCSPMFFTTYCGPFETARQT